MVDPIGYQELLALLGNSRGALTDSGTVVEETAVLGVPSLQMRKATERPQVYDCRSSVKFDPARPDDYPADELFAQARALYGHDAGSTGSATARRRSAWSTDLVRARADGHDPRPPPGGLAHRRLALLPRGRAARRCEP